MKKQQSKSFVECKTDEERAIYLEKTDIFQTGEFGELGLAEPPNKPMDKHLNMRIDGITISRLKNIAHHKGIGYQSLTRMWLIERLEKEEQNYIPKQI